MARYLVLLGLCALVAFAAAEEETYPDKYDYVDVDAILGNHRTRSQYYKCFMEEGPCLTADAKFFKDRLPEALVTKCRKCTPKQKIMIEKIVIYYTEKEPEKWNAIITRAIEKHQKKKI